MIVDRVTIESPPGPLVRCRSSWHDEPRSFRSGCPSCGGTQDAPRLVRGGRVIRIEASTSLGTFAARGETEAAAIAELLRLCADRVRRTGP